MSIAADHDNVSGAWNDFVWGKYDADFYRDAARSCVTCDRTGLEVLLERLQANNARTAVVQNRGNLSSVWYDFVCDKFGSRFYEDMAKYGEALIPIDAYPTLDPERLAFTDACRRTDQSWKWRTERAVQDVLEKWTKLRPKVETYFLLLGPDHSGYALEQHLLMRSLYQNMAKFVERYKDNKNVWV